MGFRTLEISKPAELHIKGGQLRIEQEDGLAIIPVEDLTTIVCIGSNIRLSTMAIAQLSNSNITLMILDEKYHPCSINIPYQANSRQALILRKQNALSDFKKEKLWTYVINQKIKNQAKALNILDLKGSEKVLSYLREDIKAEINEAGSAKEYFTNLYPGLNRREEHPFNSLVNYGYAVIRNVLIRSLISSGFNTSLGIHHENQLNAFNLADDLMEPFRPMVDILAYTNQTDELNLSSETRYLLAHVVHNACLIDNTKVSVLTAVDLMVESFKRCLMDENCYSLLLPEVIPVESAEMVSE